GAIYDRRAWSEMGPDRLRQIEHAEDVGLEGPFQLLLGDVGDVLVGMLLAGIVDENVDLSEGLDRLLHDAVAHLPRTYVGLDGYGPASFGLDDLPAIGGIVILEQIDNGDIGALPRIEGRHRAADAAVGAGYDRHLALEPVGAAIA